jgi:hypothetical protein
MTLTAARVLDQLPQEAPCLGAYFSSYGFDPTFFESHVLRAVLRLASDPVEQGARYHGEARQALQETPVAVVVDAGERQAGRRLPYDLLEVAEVVFHPKCALLLYNEKARLMVGSGNVTFPGFSNNAELFFCCDLRYDDPDESTLLRDFDAHLERVSGLLRQRGTQLPLFRQELHRRLGTVKGQPGPRRVALLDSTVAPMLGQLVALLPEDAVVDRLGMLAPFYERDDGGELDATSVFGAFTGRTAPGTILEVGVAWDNCQVFPGDGCAALESGLGRIWAWSHDGGPGRVVEYIVPESLGPNSLSYSDQRGIRRRRPLGEARAAAEERSLWMLPPPVAFAPRKELLAARAHFGEVRLWLHPATRLLEDRPVHRPLHAKLLVVGYSTGGLRGTMLLVGSANMSRRALLLKAGAQQGNVEVGLGFRLAGDWTLTDLVPELVQVPIGLIDLHEREFPQAPPNYGLAVSGAAHDPAESKLTVTWSEAARELPPWRLTYSGAELARSESPPMAPVVVTPFILQPASAEVILHVGGQEFAVPILVTDLVALPATTTGSGLGLDELLMLLGRRIGGERAVQIAQRCAESPGESDELATFFGEGFGPVDVFRAWWAVAEDLRDPTLSVAAFRVRLEGALGVGAAWARMLEAAESGQVLQRTEAWFYGAELLRSLGEVEVPPGVDRPAKEKVLAAFRQRVQADLDGVAPSETNRPWVEAVRRFYRDCGT